MTRSSVKRAPDDNLFCLCFFYFDNTIAWFNDAKMLPRLKITEVIHIASTVLMMSVFQSSVSKLFSISSVLNIYVVEVSIFGGWHKKHWDRSSVSRIYMYIESMVARKKRNNTDRKMIWLASTGKSQFVTTTKF